jgi:fatty-acyl-CoA synthase
MSNRHLAHLPSHVAPSIPMPATHLYRNLEISALRYPDKACVVFYDNAVSYARFQRETERIAAWLQQVGGVARGDRVLLYMQNSPQFMLAYYAILRADAVVVPVNPMNLAQELRHCASDSGAKVAFASQELLARIQPLLGHELAHLVVASYSDYLREPTSLPVPDFVAEPRRALSEADIAAGAVAWSDVLAAAREPAPLAGGPDDLCVMPYTSGTTGLPKGCMHTHRSTMVNTVSGGLWYSGNQGSVTLSVLPMFHVTGMQSGLNGTIYNGATTVLLPRWDRDAAARCVQRYGVTSMALITAMVIDFMANPRLDDYELGSLRRIGGGGAAMPRAVAEQMSERLGLSYGEGYGMSETMAATHMNPPQAPKAQCLGIPIFDVDARVVDPQTLAELPPGEVGEIVVHGPQLMRGYWNNPEATRQAFVEIDGQRFLRTGDLGRTDEEGYFFFTDRLKRMINAAGFKVWPAEVEALLHQHPAVQEACVIAVSDARRGETVKALLVLRPAFVDKIGAQEIVDWSHANMAAYKIPRIVEFVASLPRSGTGKVQWRELQERENARAAAA